MKVKTILSITIAMVTLLSLVSGGAISTYTINSTNKVSQSNLLTIYTYQSLMADPYYDIAGNFSALYGISKSDITIQRFSDANALVTRLEQEKDHPVADVVIGIDNALEYLANMSTLLTPYTNTTVLNSINPNLISNLDSKHYLVPYDYGMISFYYNNQIVNNATYPVLNNLTLNALAASPLISKLVTENPQISSTGLGFLLWTIAYFGDNQTMRNVPGLTGWRYGNWRQYWSEIHSQVNITATWNDAFTVFSDPSANRPLMVSYGTSPAYDYCVDNVTTTSAAVSKFNNTQYGWNQIEGIGLVKNSPHPALATKFVDWFLGKNLQSNIATSNWMWPANVNANIPSCFLHSALNQTNIIMLNNYLTPANIQSFLPNWLDEWQNNVVKVNLPGFTFSFFFFISFLVLVTTRKITKRKKIE